MNPPSCQSLLQKTFDRRIPLTAHCELTYRCNLACVHCYVGHPAAQTELTVQQYDDIFRQLAEAGCLFLTFTGGEALLREDALEIFQCAARQGFALRLLTNGCLLTPALAEALAPLHFLRVDFSAYAAQPQVHDAITQVEGSHAQTLRGIQLCRQQGIRTAIKLILLKSNLHEFAAVQKLAQDLGSDFVMDFALIPGPDQRPIMEEQGLSEAEISGFIRQHAQPPAQPPAPADPSAPICGAGSNVVAISPQGDVFPCLGFRKPVGNLLRQSFREIWESPPLDQLHKAMYSDFTECKGCRHEAYCIRCPGVSWAESGSEFAKSPLACRVASATKQAYDPVK